MRSFSDNVVKHLWECGLSDSKYRPPEQGSHRRNRLERSKARTWFCSQQSRLWTGAYLKRWESGKKCSHTGNRSEAPRALLIKLKGFAFYLEAWNEQHKEDRIREKSARSKETTLGNYCCILGMRQWWLRRGSGCGNGNTCNKIICLPPLDDSKIIKNREDLFFIFVPSISSIWP